MWRKQDKNGGCLPLKRNWKWFLLAAAACLVIIAGGTAGLLSKNGDQDEPRPADPSNDPGVAEAKPIFDPNLPAFPGAEGAAKYITGGRGGEIYEVTSLADRGPGTLRDAVSGSNRIIVFRVSGEIRLAGSLVISGSNLTIAGQTAPGDGITISGNQTTIEGDNIIIQHLRFRPTDLYGKEPDALTARGVNGLLIDHCSFSWGVDENLSVYASENVTIQWSIISESLALSTHSKGQHGYGGIVGGHNVTLHHNLYAFHTSRSPRFAANETGNDLIDYRNNVVYNWGFNSAYGGADSGINMIANYYKAGPDTRQGVASRIYQVDQGTRIFVADNVVEGFPQVTQNNILGLALSDNGATVLDAPVGSFDVPTETAAEAYERVLANAGATLPRRDAIDARIVQSVREGTGRIINSAVEVGGVPPFSEASAPEDSDHDGMPDSWELEQGLNPHDPSDANGDLDHDGYTNVEEYIHSLTPAPGGSPTVRLVTPSQNDIFQSKHDLTIRAEATPAEGGRIHYVAFYNGAELLAEDYTAPYEFTWKDVPQGTYYLTALAVDNSKWATFSAPVVVHVNDTVHIDPWKSADIGEPAIPGNASLISGVWTIQSSGKIGGREDQFHFAYREWTGDVAIVARIKNIGALETGSGAGIMIRSSLEPNSAMVYLEMAYAKPAKAPYFHVRPIAGANASVTEGTTTPLPAWVKLERKGNAVTGYVSGDGENWTEIGSSRDVALGSTLYIGLAANAVKADYAIDKYNTSELTDVEILPIR